MQPTDADFLRELMTVFAAEADERLSSIDRSLLEFERTSDADRRTDLVREVLRELHTLKGSTGAVNMSEASHLAHALETLIGTIDPAGIVDPALYERAYRGLDNLRSLISDHVQGAPPSLDVEAAIASVAWADPADDGPTPQRPSAPPAPEAQHAAPVPQVEPEPVAVEAATAVPAPAGGAQPAPRGGSQADETVRLATNKLDSLMARVGELVVTRISAERRREEMQALADQVSQWDREWRRLRPRSHELSVALQREQIDPEHAVRLVEQMREMMPFFTQNDERMQELGRRLTEFRSGIETDERRLGEVTGDLEDEVRRTRMLPVATIFDPLHRQVRDLSRDLGKEVGLVVHGGDTEVDRAVLEQLRSPLTHLIRNAVDHGLEAPDERERAGKQREGTIRLAAMERGGTLVVSVSDDGAGIDVDRVRQLAVERGLISSEALRGLPDREVLRLVFRSGFTTNATVTDISGRGIGLDAVRDAVERMHGAVEIAAEVGTGTTFTLSMPLSVATTRCLLVRVSGHRFALPISAVTRLVSVGPDDVGRAQGREMITLEDGPVVLARLEDVLQLTSEADGLGRKSAVIVGADERRFALLVDELLGTQDVVVKPLPAPFVRVRHAAGATVLGNGDVAIVLNGSDLIRSAMRTVVRFDGAAARREAERNAVSGQTVLVVDDSIVTRMLEKSILEAAGYSVRVAADGAEAWRILGTDPVDLVVSDVNMPKMDGLALTARIRSDARTANTPVVLVTSLDAPDDQARGMQVGADAYIVKSSFSQEGLLETVGRLI